MVSLNSIFHIDYGSRNYSNKSVLDKGKTILIASQGVDNGVYGFFDVPIKYKPPIITVPRTGSIGYAFVQLTKCNVTDDCMVLTPQRELKNEYLFYVAAIIRAKRWRFNYARKITPERLGRLQVKSPEEFETDINYNMLITKLYPKEHKTKKITYLATTKGFQLSDLFNIITGNYHSIKNLKDGKIPLISCSDIDNGISGFFDIPIRDTHKNAITVAYDGKPLTSKYHEYRFAAYDNVGILAPKKDYKKSTLLFITIALNKLRWRYSYGRKCYYQKLQKIVLNLPSDPNGKLNEDYIERIMKNRDSLGYI